MSREELKECFNHMIHSQGALFFVDFLIESRSTDSNIPSLMTSSTTSATRVYLSRRAEEDSDRPSTSVRLDMMVLRISDAASSSYSPLPSR